jgi:hypothetical protein
VHTPVTYSALLPPLKAGSVSGFGTAARRRRKRRMTPPVATIFDGEKEAKLIALACSEPPKGRARRKVGATGLFENDEAT